MISLVRYPSIQESEQAPASALGGDKSVVPFRFRYSADAIPIANGTRGTRLGVWDASFVLTREIVHQNPLPGAGGGQSKKGKHNPRKLVVVRQNVSLDPKNKSFRQSVIFADRLNHKWVVPPTWGAAGGQGLVMQGTERFAPIPTNQAAVPT
eukprot:2105611-Rhodomonas_salina.2